MARYHAIWITNCAPQGILVLPRRKGRATFSNINSASKALERMARYSAVESRGIVRDSDGADVLTIAL